MGHYIKLLVLGSSLVTIPLLPYSYFIILPIEDVQLNFDLHSRLHFVSIL